MDESMKLGVLAIGGAGISMISKLRADLPYLSRFIAIDINLESLNWSTADIKILVGDGNNRPRRTDTARFMALPIKSQIMEAIAGLDVVFLVAGMGGVTGSALSISVADLLREMPEVHLKIGIPVTPFAFEAAQRQRIASIALKSLASRIDYIIPLSNESVAKAYDDGELTSVLNQILITLKDIYTGIALTICEYGPIGVDYEDIKTVFKGRRMTVGVSTGYGTNPVRDAIEGVLQQINDGHLPLRQASSIWVVVEGASKILKIRNVHEVVNGILDFTKSEVIIGISGFHRNASYDYCKVTIYSGVESKA